MILTVQDIVQSTASSHMTEHVLTPAERTCCPCCREKTMEPPRSCSQDITPGLVLNTGLNISNRPVTVTPQTPGSASQLATIAALQQNLVSQLKQAGVPIPSNLVSAVNTLSARQSASLSQQRAIVEQPKKVNLKVRVTNLLRKEYETYVLRDVTKEEISTPMELRKEIYKQFGAKLVSSTLDFSVSYIKGNSKVTIRSPADVDDVWNMITSKGETVNLWCDRVTKRDEESSENESEQEDCTVRPKSKKKKLSALEKKNERVESLVEKLRKKHSGKFTTLQFRLWAEVVDGGSWKSLDEPPSSLPAFSGREKRTTPIAGLTTAVAEIAKACAMAQQQYSQQCGSIVSATVPSASTSSTVSPARVVDLRRNYLEQVKDLHSLLECGALTAVEFEEQKAPILEQLKKMKPM